ncbi:MAG: GNAT family N-acetyltransferase [Alphaproteobacteria bacterium]
MRGVPEYRPAELRDLPQIANLSWKLHTVDAIHFHEPTRDKYVARVVERFTDVNADGDFCHWVADLDGEIIAVMSLRIVGQMPTPGLFDGRWGYLANAYTLPDYRGQEIGTRLFEALKAWANERACAVILVWPSEKSFPFYERKGFTLPRAPMTLDLRE